MTEDEKYTLVVTIDAYNLDPTLRSNLRLALRIVTEKVCLTFASKHPGTAMSYRLEDVNALLEDL